MKKSIFKYPIEVTDKTRIMLPIGAKLLTVQTQNEIPFIWALVDPTQQKEERLFEIFGTGHPIHYDMGIERNYIGTFQMNNGQLVFHLFERI